MKEDIGSGKKVHLLIFIFHFLFKDIRKSQYDLDFHSGFPNVFTEDDDEDNQHRLGSFTSRSGLSKGENVIKYWPTWVAAHSLLK